MQLAEHPMFDRHSCLAHATEIRTSWKVLVVVPWSRRNSKLFTQLASHTTNNSVEILWISFINLQYTFDETTLKIVRQVLFPCTHVTAWHLSSLIEYTFLKLCMRIFPLYEPSTYNDWWEKPFHVRRRQIGLAGPPQWLELILMKLHLICIVWNLWEYLRIPRNSQKFPNAGTSFCKGNVFLEVYMRYILLLFN